MTRSGLSSDEVYCTPDRLYARFHASMYGRGNVYQVRPADCTLTRSGEDSVESYRCDRLKVVRVVDVHVTLTWKERRKLARKWAKADKERDGKAFDPNPVPRNATPEMLARWQEREIALAERQLGGGR